MDIPYKGYTIIPNSERQPDGRWLPVADLEASSRGVVTPQPPLRAMPREIRATRADADAVAVKMAKAWVEAVERESDGARALTGAPRPSAPIKNAVVTPRISPEPRGQDVKAPPRAKRIEAEKRTTPTDPLSWPGLHEGDRFTRLLAVHALLDRLLTLVLATKLAASSESIYDAMASLAMSSRVTLALTLNVLSPATAETILEIDRVRNGLVHSKPTRGKPAWDVGGAVEGESLSRGLEAAQGLMSALRVATPET
jgi:hypothetical protein